MRLLPFLLLPILSLLPNFAAAQNNAPPVTAPAMPVVTITLTSPQTATGTDATVPLLLGINLPEGWHTYWRTPGIAGAPPQLDWTGSKNLQQATTDWPAPTRFSQQGLETFGYEGKFSLPLTATLDTAGQPLNLALSADLIVCRDICVPAHATAMLALPAGAAKPSATQAAWQAAHDKIPHSLATDATTLDGVTVQDKAPISLIVNATHIGGWKKPDAIAEVGDISFSKPVYVINGDKAMFVLPLDSADDLPLLAGQRATLTFLDDGRATEGALTISPPAPPRPVAATAKPPVVQPTPAEPRNIVVLLLVALLGGLVLNLMPCVLPVLSLKLLSVIQHAGETKARIRAGFLATAAGILTSFWLLAAAAIALQSAGQSIGWGIQFQQPLFLAFLYAVVLAFAGNLWGWFEIALPWRWQNSLGHAATGTVGEVPSLTQEFLTGLLATLLATPCTAPFVGTSVGFALSGTAADIAAIFTALGLGLALPYLTIAAFPVLARKLPRPGRWMAGLRAILGTALLATALWVLSLLHVQLGMAATIALLINGALLLLCLWQRWLWPALALMLLLILSPLVLPARPLMVDQTMPMKLNWQKFDPAQIAPLAANGKTVVVDLSASWCLTCHANEAFVLNDADVMTALTGPNIVLMRGDWTRPDPIIANFLKERQRAGIPFTMIAGPHNIAGTILPELLTRDAVLKALQQSK